jgi:hypothetical protein
MAGDIDPIQRTQRVGWTKPVHRRNREDDDENPHGPPSQEPEAEPEEPQPTEGAEGHVHIDVRV